MGCHSGITQKALLRLKHTYLHVDEKRIKITAAVGSICFVCMTRDPSKGRHGGKECPGEAPLHPGSPSPTFCIPETRRASALQLLTINLSCAGDPGAYLGAPPRQSTCGEACLSEYNHVGLQAQLIPTTFYLSSSLVSTKVAKLTSSIRIASARVFTPPLPFSFNGKASN